MSQIKITFLPPLVPQALSPQWGSIKREKAHSNSDFFTDLEGVYEAENEIFFAHLC
jgi:hypothetical protein